MARFFLYTIGFFSFLLAGLFGFATFVGLAKPSSSYIDVLLFMTFSLCFFLSIIGDTLLAILSEVKTMRKRAEG